MRGKNNPCLCFPRLCCTSATFARLTDKMKYPSISLSLRGKWASKLGDDFIVFAFVITDDYRAYMINTDGLYDE